MTKMLDGFIRAAEIAAVGNVGITLAPDEVTALLEELLELRDAHAGLALHHRGVTVAYKDFVDQSQDERARLRNACGMALFELKDLYRNFGSRWPAHYRSSVQDRIEKLELALGVQKGSADDDYSNE